MGEREYGLEWNPMPFRPPAPCAFHHRSRINQRTVHIEQHCPAGQSQRNENGLASHEAYFLLIVPQDQEAAQLSKR